MHRHACRRLLAHRNLIATRCAGPWTRGGHRSLHTTGAVRIFDLFGKANKPTAKTPAQPDEATANATTRSLGTWAQRKTTARTPPVLAADDLFHPLSQSPIPPMREKFAFVAEHGCCPVCVKHEPFSRRLLDTLEGPVAPEAATTGDEATTTGLAADAEALHPEADHPDTAVDVLQLNKLQSQPPTFECPDCGFPTHCSEEHYLQDRENHAKVCNWLRDMNMDEHDLRSGRPVTEFNFPKQQPKDNLVNFGSWEALLYTRGFPGLTGTRAVHHITKLLTYPLTVASILHPLSPYNLKNDLTVEGLRSLTALRTTLGEHSVMSTRKDVIFDPIRVFIVGARAEAMLPPHVYLQLAYMFPHSPFHIYFIGPEATPPPGHGGQSHLGVSLQMMMRWERNLFHEFYHEVTPFDPYRDVFFLFSPGLAYPLARPLWRPSLEVMIQTQCPIFITAYSDADRDSDVAAIEADYKDTFDWLMKPTDNHFKSLKADVNLLDLTEVSQANRWLYGIRGKKYEVTFSDAE
ncbi:translational activator for mitochondrial COX1 [Tieghemiomyces parasiticus]|uniref:Translational activator for mitochondrial COX1 n=1 Tax=Tieghemiomyces parasiticus TaxID=78921 RepID=A0A9W8DMQ1_9FUNG|nr:translational activator for mitochondrial COX1 [Tieghemiomyces parasiticus]